MIRLPSYAAALMLIAGPLAFRNAHAAHRDLAAKITCVQAGGRKLEPYTYVFTTSGQRLLQGTLIGPKKNVAFNATYDHQDGVVLINTMGTLHGVLKDQAPFLTGVQLFRLEWKNDKKDLKAWTLTFLGFPSPVAGDRQVECSE